MCYFQAGQTSPFCEFRMHNLILPKLLTNVSMTNEELLGSTTLCERRMPGVMRLNLASGSQQSKSKVRRYLPALLSMG